MASKRAFPWLPFGLRVAILILVSGAINLLINSSSTAAWLKGHLSLVFSNVTGGEIDYLVFIFQALGSGLLLLLLVFCVIWLEKPASVRKFFKIGPVDLKGLGLIVLLVAVLDALEIGFLRSAIYEPVRRFLVSLGLPGQPSLSVNFTPDPHLLIVNLLLVLFIFWIEVPEEIFFRGYVQNHLQDFTGQNLALFLGAFIWTAWHFFALADFLHILVLGLAFGLVFRLRQNTTPLAIWHPLGNRLLLIFSLVSIAMARPL